MIFFPFNIFFRMGFCKYEVDKESEGTIKQASKNVIA